MHVRMYVCACGCVSINDNTCVRVCVLWYPPALTETPGGTEIEAYTRVGTERKGQGCTMCSCMSDLFQNYLPDCLHTKRFTVSRRMNTATFIWLPLTHHSQCRIYASLNWVIIVPGNGLSPFRRQAITCNNTELLLIGSLGTNFSERRIKLQSFSFIKMHLKMSSAKWCPFCPGGDELKVTRYT